MLQLASRVNGGESYVDTTQGQDAMEMEIKSSQGQSVLAVIGASRKQKRKGTDKIWFYFGMYTV